jgi:hypothetical protein
MELKTYFTETELQRAQNLVNGSSKVVYKEK